MLTIGGTYEEIQEEFEEFLNTPDIPYDKSLDWKYFSEVADNNYTGDARFEKYYEGFLEGSALCSQSLGVFYMKGDGVDEDYRVAATFFEHAARRGNALCMAYLAAAYFLDGDELFYEDAMQWISKSVIRGDGDGMILLAGWVEGNQGLRDYVECCLQIHYDKIVNKRQHTDEEYRFLGWCTWTGMCCEKDCVKAKQIWDEGGKKDLTCKTLYSKLGEKAKSRQTGFVPSFEIEIDSTQYTQEDYDDEMSYQVRSVTQQQTNETEQKVGINTWESNVKKNEEIYRGVIETPKTEVNDSKKFSIIAMALVLLSRIPIFFIVALGCALWAKKRREKLANAALIMVVVVFVLFTL